MPVSGTIFCNAESPWIHCCRALSEELLRSVLLNIIDIAGDRNKCVDVSGSFL